jgi:NADH-quinone oxidoreductase subunit E
VNKLRDKYTDEITNLLKKYPADQRKSAVMPLLFLAQREQGFVSNHAIEDIANILDISTTQVASIIGFYTLYHDQPGGKVRIQVCTDLPCALRGADQFLKELCEALEIQPGETTADGLITVEEVMCLAACDKAPMFQTQTGDHIEYHEKMTVEKTLQWIDTLKTNS